MSSKTKEIRKRIQVEEEKKGRELTKKERQKIEKKVISKYRRESFIRGAFLAVGITIGTGGHALLTAGNDKVQENKTQTETTIDNIDSEKEEQSSEQEKSFKGDIKIITYNQITEDIAREYNEKYNANLSAADIAYIQTNPQFLFVDDKGTYIQDYKQSENYSNYIDSGIDDIYVFINKNDNTIISSIGKVSNDIQNINTKIVMGADRKEYIESDKKIDIVQEKNKEEKQKIYEAMQQKAQQKTQNNTQEKQIENEERE